MFIAGSHAALVTEIACGWLVEVGPAVVQSLQSWLRFEPRCGRRCHRRHYYHHRNRPRTGTGPAAATSPAGASCGALAGVNGVDPFSFSSRTAASRLVRNTKQYWIHEIVGVFVQPKARAPPGDPGSYGRCASCLELRKPPAYMYEDRPDHVGRTTAGNPPGAGGNRCYFPKTVTAWNHSPTQWSKSSSTRSVMRSSFLLTYIMFLYSLQ